MMLALGEVSHAPTLHQKRPYLWQNFGYNTGEANLKIFYAIMTSALPIKSAYIPAPKLVVALVNPRSGARRGQQVIHFLKTRQWGAEVAVFETQPNSMEGHQAAIEFARQQGADRLLISGGDGT